MYSPPAPKSVCDVCVPAKAGERENDQRTKTQPQPYQERKTNEREKSALMKASVLLLLLLSPLGGSAAAAATTVHRSRRACKMRRTPASAARGRGLIFDDGFFPLRAEKDGSAMGLLRQ